VSGTIEAVTFDYWNTLVREAPGHLRGRRIAAWAGLLAADGLVPEPGLLDAVFDAGWERYDAAWRANRQYAPEDAADELVDALGLDVPPALRAALVHAFCSAGDDAELALTANIGACLRRLRDAGVRIGIVCDVGMTGSRALRSHLDRNGLLDLFDHWSFSDEVGVYKPSALIFEHALAGLGGIAADRAAHVGDLRRTDIAGARAMGMLAVRYTGVFDDAAGDGPEGDVVVADHLDLCDAIGVGR
jgi:putative hydrolase of the HAD superfamily